MTALVLGPAGVLPPGEWAIGARVWAPGWSGPSRVVVRDDEDAPLACLDLTHGPLDFGTRALLHLVAPDVEQPLCAPAWEIAEDRIEEIVCWVFRGKTCFYDPAFGSIDGREEYVCVSGIAHADPRRALALALEAAAGR